MFGATFFWGTTATLARFAFRDLHVPALTAVELRLSISVLLLGIFLRWRRPHLLRIERKDLGTFVVLALFGLATVQGSYYYSISVLGVGLAILIQYLAPSLLVMIDVARGVHVTRLTLLAVGAALIGTALLLGNVDPRSVKATPIQWTIGFSSALSFAFYITWSKRVLTRYAPETVLFHTFWMAALVWAIVTPPWKIIAAGYDLRIWSIFLALALFSTLVPFLLFNRGLRRLRPTEAGVLATLEPLVAVVSAALFLNERLTPLQNVGALLVVTAAVLSTQRESGA